MNPAAITKRMQSDKVPATR